MKKQAILITALIFIFGITMSAFGADVAKIGILDFQKILNESSAGKIVQKQLRTKLKEINNTIISISGTDSNVSII